MNDCRWISTLKRLRHHKALLQRVTVLLVTIGLILLITAPAVPKNLGKFRFGRHDLPENLTKRFDERNARLAQRCEELKERNENKAPSRSYWQRLAEAKLLYNVDHKFMVCIVAKAGASTWRTHFLHMLGVIGDVNPHTEQYRELVEAHALMTMKQIGELQLDRYATWVVNTRHPLERLVSGYRDKFLNGEGVKEEKWVKYVRWARQEEDSIYIDVRLSFPYFLKAVVIDKRLNGREWMNLHFRPSSTICSPCSIRYDYIVDTSTIGDDIDYIAQLLYLDNVDPQLRKNSKAYRSNSTSYEDYYKDVHPALLKEVYAIYEEDFFLYEYEKPEFLKKALGEV